ncbi:hypothetical protein KQX54_000282 [Cotesia glomerata]|uniref:Uncharacterized protein n=1 Tax=Cotesia glomerata TaxID=32391 RepID=A0AAV7IXA2_COTGL|nr:hypothetical protein KQX54_000282 [Cotesia glomerata]
MESAEPEILDLQAELDEKWKDKRRGENDDKMEVDKIEDKDCEDKILRVEKMRLRKEDDVKIEAMENSDAEVKNEKTEPTELKIPIFPPPASPGYERCESPAPLILTQDEAAQLEYLKVHGLPQPGEAKPVLEDLRYGWWRDY